MNVTKIAKNFHVTKLISIFFLINFLKISSANLLLQNEYNFVDKQNYEIDLNYNQILGTNLFFYSNDNLSLFIVRIYPDVTLSITMKLYTSDSYLINVIDQNNSIFMGIDFNTPNLDIYFQNFQSDVFLCNFGKNNSNCSDYAINLQRNKYINNKNAKVIQSKKICLIVR